MRIMAVDLGLARTGLALSDPSGSLASPIGVLEERDEEGLLERVAAAAREHAATEVVIGHPRNMDGTRGESAQRSEAFVERLSALLEVPVRLWDERMTTVSAIGYLNATNIRGVKRKKVVDAVAATIILQDYLDSRRLRGGQG